MDDMNLPSAREVETDLDLVPQALFRAMVAQRRISLARKTERIGGGAVLTELAGLGEITQRVVHRWPDVIGEPVGGAELDAVRGLTCVPT